MSIKKAKKERYTFTLDPSLYDKFRKFCTKEGLIMSRKVEAWMKNFLKDKKEIQ